MLTVSPIQSYVCSPRRSSTPLFLKQVPNTFPAGQGEPLNVIISGKSDPTVLQTNADQGGLFNYFLSLNFGTSCGGGITLGDKQSANLGNGQGFGAVVCPGVTRTSV